MSDIRPATVIRALYDLGFDCHNEAVTAEHIADYLRCEIEEVLPILRDLKRRRLIKDSRRKAGRVWMPWRGQR